MISASMVTPKWLACAGQVGGNVVIFVSGFKGVVAGVAPQHRGHTQLVGSLKRLGSLQ